jgi:flagellar basal body-associated protein FliL
MNKVLVALIIVLSTVLVVGGIFTYSLIAKHNNPTTTYDPGSEFITNLNEENSLIKAKLILEVSNKKMIKSLEKDNHIVRDAIITVLRQKTPGEINQENGMEMLKEDIINHLNEVFETEAFVNVYFEEIVVQ